MSLFSVMTRLYEGIARFLGFTRVNVAQYQAALVWRDGDLRQRLTPGIHWLFAGRKRLAVELLERRDPFIHRDDLDVVVNAGVLGTDATVLALDSHQRALVWVDGVFAAILPPGRHAWWNAPRTVRHEVVDIREKDGRFLHPDLAAILATPGVIPSITHGPLVAHTVSDGETLAWYRDGQLVELLPPGRWCWWRETAQMQWRTVDLREQTLELSGQDILTADKVSLRLNAMVSYRVSDPRKSLSVTADVGKALYREAQLALRAAVGDRELDALLSAKDALGQELSDTLTAKASGYGLELVSVGVRDLILPGEMRALLNRVTEAKKAAEASVVERREETAAMRHQLNTARLLADNPTLMRLRELETLEKVAAGGKLKVLLGEKKLAETLAGLV